MDELGIRLQLFTEFAKSATTAAADLDKICKGLVEIKEAAAGISDAELRALQTTLVGVRTAAGEAATAIRSASGAAATLETKAAGAAKTVSNLSASLAGVAMHGDNAARNLSGVTLGMDNIGRASTSAGTKAKAATQDIAAGASTAASEMLRLTTAVTNLGRGRVVIDSMGNAFTPMQVATLNTVRMVNELDAAILRLPGSKTVTIRYEQITSGLFNPRNAPAVIPMQTASEGRGPTVVGYQQRALPPGGGAAYSTGDSFNPRNAPVTIDSATGAIIPGSYFAGGSGGNAMPTLDELNGQPWWRNLRYPSSGFGGGIQRNSARAMRFGNQMQGAGMAGAVNAAMIGSIAIPLIGGAMTTQDQLAVSQEGLAHAGASESEANAFLALLRKKSVASGGDYSSNVAGFYQFITGTSQSGIRYNSKADREKMAEAYDLIVKTNLSEQHPGQTGAMALNVLATAKNFGFKMQGADDIHKGVDFSTNFLVAMKNKTPSSAEQAAMAVRQIGPIMAMQGAQPEDIAFLIDILARNKIFGSQAGTQIKRIFTRQATDPRALSKLQAFFREKSHGEFNLSEYDKQGHFKSPIDFIADVASAEKKYLDPKDARGRAYINSIMAGNYAIPAMGSLTNYAVQHGGLTPEATRANMHKDAHALLTQLPAGARHGETMVTATSRIRQEGNVEQELKKTTGHFKDQAEKDLTLMAPEIIKLLHSINGLIDAWGKLDPAVRKNVLTWGGIAVAGTAILGVGGMLIGNFIKLGGAIGSVIGFSLRVTEFLFGIEKGGLAAAKIFQPLFGIVPKLGPMLMEAFSAGAMGVRLFVGALMANPIGLIITAIIGVGTLLYFAWTRDWGGIREKTKIAIDGIMFGLNAFDAGLRSFLGKIGDFGKNLAHSLVNGIGDLEHSGEALIDGFLGGVKKKLDGAPPVVKAALKGISNLFGHSPPPDSSSPLYGVHVGAGAAMANDFIDEAFLTFIGNGGKIKKATKHVARQVTDTFIELKNETPAAIEAMAKRIEESLIAAGHRVKKVWIDLFDPATQSVTKVQGVPFAYREAIRMSKPGHDGSANAARQYMLNEVADIRANPNANGQDLYALAENIRSFEKFAITDAARAQIERMAKQVEAAAHRAEARIDAAYKRLYNSFYGKGAASTKIDTEFGIEDKYARSYSEKTSQYDEKLSNLQRLRKDENDPSKTELSHELSNRETLKNDLTRIIDQEIDERARLKKSLDELQTAYNKLDAKPDKTQDEIALRDQLKTRLEDLVPQYDALDTRIQTQQTDLVKLNQTIATYKTNIENAKAALSGWALILSNAMDKGVKAASDSLGKGIGDLVDKMADHFLQGANKKQDVFRTAIDAFVKTMLGSIISTTINSMFTTGGGGLSGFFSSIAAGNDPFAAFSGKSKKKTTGMGSTTEASSTKTPSGTLSDPIVTTTVAQASTTDVGSQTADAVSSIATTIKDAQSSSSPDVLNTLPTLDPKLYPSKGSAGAQETAFILQKATSAAMAYQGLVGNPGGISGAIESYQGVSGLFSGGAAGAGGAGPYVAAAAAIYSYIAGNAPSHNPINQPDQHQAGYGTFVSNLNGLPGTFAGNVVAPQQPFDMSAGNQSLSQQLNNYLSAPNSIAGLTSTQKAEYLQLKALGNGTGTGLGVTGEHNDTFTLGSGKTINVEQYETLISEVTSMMGTFNQNALQAAQDANRLASSFTSMMIGGPAGFVMPMGSNVGGALASGGNPVRTDLPGMRAQPPGPPPSPAAVVVNILQGAVLPPGVTAEDVGQMVAAQASNITAAVNRANYQNLRLTGNYVSETS